MSPLLREIEAFCAAKGIKPSMFGRRVVGDPRLVSDLRAGRMPRESTTTHIRAFIARGDV